ncbi:serine/threonine-protein kinase [Streptomyces xanthophaeus]|uniref:serine/threonine-protein kinase n=1 Tax=Streptomyces xanthophaeus TaxID=67385 RepID=UPI0026498BFA|nr:serine/threonine-protein kinase [Streptomyces xanthophaeus]WKD36119.1 serine/threonine protein kinase [Streptomyces xanthophaeus]
MRGALLEGRYRLERRLGAGGMGEVWQARDLRLDREVAVKVISRGVAGDHLLEERFRKEARTAAGLTHPRIVTVHDHGEVEVEGSPVLFLVMELVRGRPLTAVLRDHRSGVDPAAVVRWAVQICEGLAAAHRAGVVHRDIKPANIMVHGPAEADVTICDFGIARFAEETGTGLTATGAAIGTPTYMSPEQARGDRRIDGRSDLYSLGCMLYELLAGRPPFTGSGLSVLSQHLTGEPAPIRDLRPGVPEELERLVLELLAKEPSSRPADAQQVIDRLRKGAAGARSRSRSRTVADPAPGRDTETALGTDAPPAGPDVRAGTRHPIPASSVPGTRPRLLWGSLLAAAGVYTQLVVLGEWGSLTLRTLGAALLACLLAFLVSRSSADVTEEESRGVAAALTAGVLIGVLLLFWPPAPWWVGVLVLLLSGFVLLFLSHFVRGVVGAVARRDPWVAWLGTEAGLFNAVVFAGILAADGRAVYAAVGWGLAVWPAAALVTAVFVPRLQEAQAPA